VNADDEPLYKRDPAAWQAYLAEGNAKQPRKRVAADVLIHDQHGRILLVDPKYKPDWDLPGGMAETNEPPHLAAQRELREELGIQRPITDLLVIDWVSPHGPWDDSLMFIFNGGTLETAEIAALRLSDDELSDYQFCTHEETAARLRPYVWQRVQAALHALHSGRATYILNGQTPAG
jgi:8-oxo-dGTP diphosphatase